MRLGFLLLSALFATGLALPAAAQVGDCSADVCPVLLEFVEVTVDPGEPRFVTADGLITEADEEGGKGTYSWSAPPATITSRGFTLELRLEGKAGAPDDYYPMHIYASGPFAFDPDPPQMVLYLLGNEGSDTLSVHVSPMSSSLAGGLYTLSVGAAFSEAAVHYVYRTVPQLIE